MARDAYHDYDDLNYEDKNSEMTREDKRGIIHGCRTNDRDEKNERGNARKKDERYLSGWCDIDARNAEDFQKKKKRERKTPSPANELCNPPCRLRPETRWIRSVAL